MKLELGTGYDHDLEAAKRDVKDLFVVEGNKEQTREVCLNKWFVNTELLEFVVEVIFSCFVVLNCVGYDFFFC